MVYFCFWDLFCLTFDFINFFYVYRIHCMSSPLYITLCIFCQGIYRRILCKNLSSQANAHIFPADFCLVCNKICPKTHTHFLWKQVLIDSTDPFYCRKPLKTLFLEVGCGAKSHRIRLLYFQISKTWNSWRLPVL